MSPADVLKLIKEKGVKFVDLRFTDTRGKEQHVTVPHASGRRRHVRRRQDVRRFVDCRLEGHQRVGHDPRARSRDRGARPVHGRDHPEHPLRHHRAVDDAGLRARSALRRQARRGLHALDRYRRRGVLRARERVLHIRRRALGVADAHRVLRHRLVRRRVAERQGNRGRQPRPPARASRAATSRFRRSTRCRTSAPRCAWRSRRWAWSSKCTTTRWRRPASARSA